MHTQSHKTISSPRGKGYRSKTASTNDAHIYCRYCSRAEVLPRCVRVQMSHPIAGESVPANNRASSEELLLLLLLLPTSSTTSSFVRRMRPSSKNMWYEGEMCDRTNMQMMITSRAWMKKRAITCRSTSMLRYCHNGKPKGWIVCAFSGLDRWHTMYTTY